MIEWRTVALGEEVTLQRGIDITKKTMKPGDVPVISSGGINGYHDTPIASGPGVLLGRKGSVGKVHYIETAYWPHDTTLWVRDFHGNHPRFVYHFFSQFPISLYEASTANPSLNRNNLHPVKVFWPPLAEQRRIAEVLDRAEALRAKRRAALAQLDTLTQSLFLDFFGDPVTNPKGWPTQSLTETCHCYSGGTPSKSNPSFWVGEIPWFSAKDLKADDLFDSQDHISPTVPKTTPLRLLPENTVAIVVRGMILAHTFPVSVLRIPATINQDLKALLPKLSIEPQFLAASLRVQRGFALQQVSEAAHGTKRLDAEGLREIRILLPPLDLQREFARQVAAVEKLKTAHRASLAELDALFAALQHRAFRGEL